MRILWFSLGALSFGLGAIGAVLPVLPTTPFMILAALCFGKSSPSLQAALHRNRMFGPMIRDWEAHGTITPRVKWIACTMMAAVFVVSLYLGAPPVVLAVQAIAMGTGAAYVLSRPSRPRHR